jgi:hypothetical protein
MLTFAYLQRVCAVQSTPPPDPARVPTGWAGRALLVVLPVVVTIAFYHPVWSTGRAVDLGPDSQFYIYQMGRIADLHGAWWRLGDDPRVGAPYATGAAKNPGLYEGLDVMPAAAIVGQWLSPRRTFVFVSLLVLAFNGWVVGWITSRLTRSLSASALAIVFVTVNQPTLCRYGEHLHLYKYGWVLLAIWAYSRYLDIPSLRRGAFLGLMAAVTLVSSFHFGYFLGLALGVWWLGCLAARKLTWGHFKAATVAVAVGGLAAAIGTFPVWTAQAEQTQARLYHERQASDLWRYSAELWQYVTRPDTSAADRRLKAAGRDRPLGIETLTNHPFDEHVRQVCDRYGDAWGGWYYLGWGMLAGLAGFAALRLRGHTFGLERPAILDRMAGLLVLFVVLSLSGGPGALLYELFPQFRCYGRAGLLVLPLAAVLSAVAVHAAVMLCPSRPARSILVAVVVAVLAHDWRVADRLKIPPIQNNPPAWSDWLAAQPADVRLAAFPSVDRTFCRGEIWHWQSLALSLTHRHSTLNGAELSLLTADLNLLGSDYHRMSPVGLRFAATLGYDAFAFDEGMLQRCQWLGELPWLHKTAPLAGGWSIWQVAADVPRFPTATRTELVKRGMGGIHQVPAGAVVTLPLDVAETTIATDADMVESAWVDERGVAGSWSRVLEQRVYGPGLGAIVTQAPAAGTWRLRFRNAETHQVLAEHPIRVRSDLASSKDVPTTCVVVTPLAQFSDGGCVIRLRNTTDRYLLARRDDQVVSHPNLSGIPAGTTFLVLRARTGSGAAEEQLAIWTSLTCDLPPHGEVLLSVPAGALETPLNSGTEVVAALCVAPSELRPTSPTSADVVVELQPRPPAGLAASRLPARPE